MFEYKFNNEHRQSLVDNDNECYDNVVTRTCAVNMRHCRVLRQAEVHDLDLVHVHCLGTLAISRF